MNFDFLIREAISNRLVLLIRYGGLAYRLVEPHAYGETQKGHQVLLAWQQSNSEKPMAPQEFRLFHSSKIEAASKTGNVFQGARPGYKRDDPAMQIIYAQL